MVSLHMKTLDNSLCELICWKVLLSSSCTYSIGLHYVVKALNAIEIMVHRSFCNRCCLADVRNLLRI